MDELPGEDLVSRGLSDWTSGKRTAEALLCAVGAPRLARLGLRVPSIAVEHPELDLYLFLAESDPRGAHGRYLALVRRLESYERALEHRRYAALRRAKSDR